MARTFGGVSTDKLNCSPHAAINDIANSGSGVTIGGTIRFTNLVDFQRICSKVSNTAVDGFSVNLQTQGGAQGCIGVSFGSAGVRYEAAASGAANACGLNQNEIWATTFIANSQPKIYRGINEPTNATWISEVSAYFHASTGSGTPGADAAFDLAYGNNGSSVRVINGDAGWFYMYAAILTPKQLRRVQYGILVHCQGLNENDAAKQTRGVNILKSIANYRMLRYLHQDGTISEFSGNVYANTLTGTTGVVNNEPKNFDCPTSMDDDYESSNTLVTQEQFDFFYVSSHARAAYLTNATAGRMMFFSTLSGFTAQSTVCMWLNNTQGSPHTSLTQAALDHNVGGYSGLSAGSKTLVFQNSVRSRAGSGDVHLGSFLNVIWFNQPATRVPATPGNVLLGFTSSTPQGFNAVVTQLNSHMQRVRNNPPGWIDSYADIGFGGQRAWHFMFDATAIARTKARILAINPRAILIDCMLGDYSMNLAGWTAALYGTRLATLIADLRAAGWWGAIYVADQQDAPLYEPGTNVNGNTVQDYRNVIASTCAGLPLVFTDSKEPLPVVNSGDGVHTDAAGQLIIYDDYSEPMFAADPFQAAATSTSALLLAGGVTATVTNEATSMQALPLAGAAAATAAIALASTQALPLGGSVTATAVTIESQVSSTASLPLGGAVSAVASIDATSARGLPLAGSASAAVAITADSARPLPLTGSAAAVVQISSISICALPLGSVTPAAPLALTPTQVEPHPSRRYVSSR